MNYSTILCDGDGCEMGMSTWENNMEWLSGVADEEGWISPLEGDFCPDCADKAADK